MKHVNMHEAKTQLSKLVDAIESGSEDRILIARNGRPAAMLVPIARPGPGIRLGLARGKFSVPSDIDQDNAEIARLFYADAQE